MVQILLLWLTSETMYTQILIKQTYEIRDTNSLTLQNKCALGITCVQGTCNTHVPWVLHDQATSRFGRRERMLLLHAFPV